VIDCSLTEEHCLVRQSVRELVEFDDALGCREDRPIRCEPLPARGSGRRPALGLHG
jgi:hypothetical protein